MKNVLPKLILLAGLLGVFPCAAGAQELHTNDMGSRMVAALAKNVISSVGARALFQVSRVNPADPDFRIERNPKSAEKKHNQEVGLNFIIAGIIGLTLGGFWLSISDRPQKRIALVSGIGVCCAGLIVFGLFKALF
jgi:hypothetical protein